MTSATFDDEGELWVVETDQGNSFEVTYLIMATGPLSVPKGLDVPGKERFAGDIHLSGRWPRHPVDFAGKRVGVIGTDSTGIQIVPVVAEQAERLVVFQRTPSFTLPMRNRKLDADYVAQIKAHYPKLPTIARNTFSGGARPVSSRPLFSVPADECQRLMGETWRHSGIALLGLLFDQQANDVVAEFVRRKIGEMVDDPKTAEVLTPRGYPIFARRPCLDNGYYEAFNRDNVSLVDCVNEPIVEITEKGIRTGSREIDLDVIVAATGYDGLTGAMLAVDVKGREGRSLREKWGAGACSCLGLMMEGFPNLFMIARANGPSALADFVILNEQNADWICDCIAYTEANGHRTIEAAADAERGYMSLVTEIAGRSLISKANTWHVGANIPGKPRFFPIFVGGLSKYRDMCADAATARYRDFTLDGGATGAAATRSTEIVPQPAF